MAHEPARSANEPDPYVELGVETHADQRAIRRAYHARARLRHPDKGGNAAAMARINAAYELLKDSRRRAAFDAARTTAAGPTRPPGAPPWTGIAGPPPGRPSGPVLHFGIFAGWSLGEIARRDPGYLAWLAERREGVPYLAAIETLLAPMRAAARTPAPEPSKRRFGR